MLHATLLSKAQHLANFALGKVVANGDALNGAEGGVKSIGMSATRMERTGIARLLSSLFLFFFSFFLFEN